jgi:hypothetical protein
VLPLVLLLLLLASSHTQQVTAACTPTAPVNGAFGTCSSTPNSLASGATCLPVCFPPFVESGPSSCSSTTLTSATCAVCPLKGKQWNAPQTSQLALLRGSTTVSGQFGRALAFSASGALLVVGAPFDTNGGSQSRPSSQT